MRLKPLLAVVISLCFYGNAVYAKDTTTPDYLRDKHAGVISLTSNRSVSDLYPVIHDATARCWADVTNTPTLLAAGAAREITRAQRVVLGELSPDGLRAYVIIQARTAFGLHYGNFLQADLEREANGTRINVYYRSNVKGQRDFAREVQHWLDGDTNWCAPSLSKVKPRQTP